MLTEEEFYIDQEVYDTIQANPETYENNLEILKINPGHPTLEFIRETIFEHKNLTRMVYTVSRLEEFIINSLYFINQQISRYEQDDTLSRSSARELAQADLVEIYGKYDKKTMQPIF